MTKPRTLGEFLEEHVPQLRREALEPSAYPGATLWRAAVTGQSESDTGLMTAHVFETEAEAFAFAQLWMEGSSLQRRFLAYAGSGLRERDHAPPGDEELAELLRWLAELLTRDAHCRAHARVLITHLGAWSAAR